VAEPVVGIRSDLQLIGAIQMRYKALAFFFACVTGLTFFVPQAICSESEKASTILKGVRSARESLPCCRFDLAIDQSYKDRHGKETRVATSWKVTLMPEEVLFRQSGEKDACLLRPHEVVTSSGSSASVYALTMDSGASAFDPRLLGLCLGPFANSSLPTALRLDGSSSDLQFETLSDPKNPSIWNVKIKGKDGVTIGFWVDVDNHFRVERFEYVAPETQTETTTSQYSSEFADAGLPNKVVTKGSNLISGSSYSRTYVLSNFAVVPERPLDLSDLEMDMGATYADIRQGKRIGYWNGVKLVPDLPFIRESIRQAAPEFREREGSWERWAIAGLLAVLVGVGIAILYRKSRAS